MARNVFWVDVHPKCLGRIHLFPGALDDHPRMHFRPTSGGPFGGILADLGPSGPRHPTREGFAASDFIRGSSVALGPTFGHSP